MLLGYDSRWGGFHRCLFDPMGPGFVIRNDRSRGMPKNYTTKVQATVMQLSIIEVGLDNFKTSRWVSAARLSPDLVFNHSLCSSLRRSRARHQPRKKCVLSAPVLFLKSES